MKRKKLLKKERTINIYKKTNNKYLGNPLKEINIDHIPFDILKSIIIPNSDDPFLYDGYPLNKDELTKLSTFLKEKIILDFELNDYALECYSI